MTNLQHAWNVTPQQAITLQQTLATQVINTNQLNLVKTVAGVDASYKDGIAQAAIAVLTYPQLKLVDYSLSQQPITFPYIPGLLSFREGPVVIAALNQLNTLPDLLIFDGQGFAHPRRFGLACHIGVLTGLPAIGCAKTRLCGQYDEPGINRGEFSQLIDGQQTIGAVLRTRTNVKPVFVSIGHKVDLQTSLDYVLSCTTRYRLPETTRWADQIAGGVQPAL